jgi:poly(3-hydroxyalkanoate) synthetase
VEEGGEEEERGLLAWIIHIGRYSLFIADALDIRASHAEINKEDHLRVDNELARRGTNCYERRVERDGVGAGGVVCEGALSLAASILIRN